MNLSDRKPGCYNQPRPKLGDTYYVLTRKYLDDGSGRFYLEDEPISYNFTTECHHDGIYSNCTGCEHERK